MLKFLFESLVLRLNDESLFRIVALDESLFRIVALDESLFRINPFQLAWLQTKDEASVTNLMWRSTL